MYNAICHVVVVEGGAVQPDKEQLEVAKKLGIDAAGLSSEELGQKIDEELERLSRLKAYRKVANHLRSLGVEPGQVKYKDLVQQVIETLQARLEERGIVKDAVIYMPPEAPTYSRHGEALVTTGKVSKSLDTFTISLKFGESRPFSFNAFHVLNHAQVRPKT